MEIHSQKGDAKDLAELVALGIKNSRGSEGPQESSAADEQRFRADSTTVLVKYKDAGSSCKLPGLLKRGASP